MDKNVGSIDKYFRLFLGAAIIVLGIIFKSWWGGVGIIPIFTGLIGRCPAYMPFGINTCKTKK